MLLNLEISAQFNCQIPAAFNISIVFHCHCSSAINFKIKNTQTVEESPTLRCNTCCQRGGESCVEFWSRFGYVQRHALLPAPTQHVLAACLNDGPYAPLWDVEEDCHNSHFTMPS